MGFRNLQKKLEKGNIVRKGEDIPQRDGRENSQWLHQQRLCHWRRVEWMWNNIMACIKLIEWYSNWKVTFKNMIHRISAIFKAWTYSNVWREIMVIFTLYDKNCNYGFQGGFWLPMVSISLTWQTLHDKLADNWIQKVACLLTQKLPCLA